jgi:hypothetical protein
MADAEIEAIREILAAHPRPTDLSERRKRLDALGAQYPLPPDVRVETVEANGVTAEWTTTPQADPAHVIMFLHGGGYISGSIDSHRHMIAQAGREAQARTLALGYRLAPEHPFPAALDDAVAGYRFLLSQGFAPEKIAIAGERRRRPRDRGAGGASRCGRGPAGLRMVQLAVGRPGDDRRQHDDEGDGRSDDQQSLSERAGGCLLERRRRS